MNKQRKPHDVGIKIQVDAVAMQKLWLWTFMAEGEVSCLGTVDELSDGLLVTDFHLVKQTCTDMDTELNSEAVSQLMQEVEDPSKLRCWAHSHADMEVFWSATDDETIKGLSNGEWLLSLVVNKYRHSMMRLDQYHPAHLCVSDVVWEVHYPAVKGLEKKCAKEFKAKVKERPALMTMHSDQRELAYGFLPEDMEDVDFWEDYHE